MWMTSDKVFPHNQQNIAEHNLTLLRQFYITQQVNNTNITTKQSKNISTNHNQKMQDT
jgi:hypothetical protein